MNNNQRSNQIVIKQFRKELSAMFEDIKGIDKKCLDRAVNLGSAYVKRHTPVVTGFMRKSWHVSRTEIKTGGVEKSLFNSMDYSSYVNDGHRMVNGAGETTGWVKGQFMLERAIRRVDKSLEREFKKEIERVNKKHDK